MPATIRADEIVGRSIEILFVPENHAKRIAVFEQFTLRVAPIPVLAILKIVAYQDRPQERERDLADLAYILILGQISPRCMLSLPRLW